jgi:hypothetical protein
MNYLSATNRSELRDGGKFAFAWLFVEHDTAGHLWMDT